MVTTGTYQFITGTRMRDFRIWLLQFRSFQGVLNLYVAYDGMEIALGSVSIVMLGFVVARTVSMVINMIARCIR